MHDDDDDDDEEKSQLFLVCFRNLKKIIQKHDSHDDDVCCFLSVSFTLYIYILDIHFEE